MAAVHPCRFRWNIFSPFVPFRRMVAIFYHTSPTLTIWKVTLEPDDRSTNFWIFRFSLHGVKYGEPHGIIVTDRIEVNVSINGRNMNHKVENGYYFGWRNRHRYEFSAYAHTHPLLRGAHHLVVDVEVTFPGPNIANRGNGFMFDEDDLVRLSDDLRRLLVLAYDCDLTLQSSNPFRNHSVHSYIMLVRWSKFYAVHSRIENATVDMNMTTEVLKTILVYMYSGVLDRAGGNLGNPSFVTEMFRVIDRYEMHHLYALFARDDAQQVRTTRKHLIINIKNFRLDDDNGRAMHDRRYMWRVNENTEHEFIFRIRFLLGARNPYFLYTLESRSRLRMHAQVNLEFKKRFEGLRTRTWTRSVHERDYTIKSNETADSGTCHFEGDMDDLNAFISGRRRYRRGVIVRHYIRCVLYLSDGTSSIQIESEDDLGVLENRVDVLSDHMFQLVAWPFRTNFDVTCTDFPHVIYNLHRSIFRIRVPGWRAVLGNISAELDFPNAVFLDISSEAFQQIFVYIYIGKVFRILVPDLDEMGDFAEQGGLIGLMNLINQMR